MIFYILVCRCRRASQTPQQTLVLYVSCAAAFRAERRCEEQADVCFSFTPRCRSDAPSIIRYVCTLHRPAALGRFPADLRNALLAHLQRVHCARECRRRMVVEHAQLFWLVSRLACATIYWCPEQSDGWFDGQLSDGFISVGDEIWMPRGLMDASKPCSAGFQIRSPHVDVVGLSVSSSSSHIVYFPQMVFLTHSVAPSAFPCDIADVSAIPVVTIDATSERVCGAGFPSGSEVLNFLRDGHEV